MLSIYVELGDVTCWTTTFQFTGTAWPMAKQCNVVCSVECGWETISRQVYHGRKITKWKIEGHYWRRVTFLFRWLHNMNLSLECSLCARCVNRLSWYWCRVGKSEMGNGCAIFRCLVQSQHKVTWLSFKIKRYCVLPRYVTILSADCSDIIMIRYAIGKRSECIQQRIWFIKWSQTLAALCRINDWLRDSYSYHNYQPDWQRFWDFGCRYLSRHFFGTDTPLYHWRFSVVVTQRKCELFSAQ